MNNHTLSLESDTVRLPGEREGGSRI